MRDTPADAAAVAGAVAEILLTVMLCTGFALGFVTGWYWAQFVRSFYDRPKARIHTEEEPEKMRTIWRKDGGP